MNSGPGPDGLADAEALLLADGLTLALWEALGLKEADAEALADGLWLALGATSISTSTTTIWPDRVWYGALSP